ncbi:MAG: hypothetical protein NC078_11675 [Ruminococcus sp.]|nr:hypothetical protein [Ruminococcus sp.]
MFYDNLKQECERQGLKVTPIVLECGGNKGSLSGWKKGASPNSDIVIKLSVRLNVPTDLLLLGKSATLPINDPLPTDQQELLDKYTELTEREQGRVLQFMEDLIAAHPSAYDTAEPLPAPNKAKPTAAMLEQKKYLA